MGNDYTVKISNQHFDTLVKNYCLERADGFQDLVNVLNTFRVTNQTEIIRKYSRERMLKITAL